MITVKTIDALYGQSIGDNFPIVGTNGRTYDQGERWDPQSNTPYNEVLVYIDVMPDANVTFRLDVANRPLKTMNWYVEALPNETGTTFSAPNHLYDYDNVRINAPSGKRYVLYKSISARYNGVTVEDFIEINGCNRLGSDEARDGRGYYIYDEYNNGTINFYYTRNTYTINFMDGKYVDGDGNPLEETNMGQISTESGKSYGSDISSYNSYTPNNPPSGYVFEGWYLDDACTQRYTFGTMPEGGITVYAKWRQKQYRVFLHVNYPDGATGNIDWGTTNQAMTFRISEGGHVSEPTGRNLDGFEFVGWYLNPECNQMFDGEVYVINEDNVTEDYDKTVDMTDTYDNNGKLLDPKSNSDATGNDGGDRFWITKKLDIYAKWRSVIEGAIGINLVYEVGTGLVSPIDTFLYLDNVNAVAREASSAPDGKVFSHWVLQKWNKTTSEFEDKTDDIYPGETFKVLLRDAKQDPDGTYDNGDPKYIYTIKLKGWARQSTGCEPYIAYNNGTWESDDCPQVKVAADIMTPRDLYAVWLPQVDLTEVPRSFCQNATEGVTLPTDASSDNNVTLTWTYNGQIVTEINTSAVVTDTVYTYTTADGCVTDTIHVTVHPLPTVDLESDPASPACAGEDVTISAVNAQYVTQYSWNGGVKWLDVPIQDSVYQDVQENFTAVLMVRSSFACQAAEQIQIEVNPLPVVEITPVEPLCPDAQSATIEVKVTSPTAANYNYHWTSNELNLADNSSSANTTESFQATISNSGVYNISIVVTDGNGCSSEEVSETVTVKDETKPTIVGTLAEHEVAGCSADLTSLYPAATTVAGLEELGLTITDNCTSDAEMAVTSEETNTGSCPIVVTRTYTVTDKSGNDSTISQTIKVVKGDFTIGAADGSSTVNCVSAVEAPTLPVVADSCGTTITPALKTNYPTSLEAGKCEGDIVYVYTYTDCAGHSHDWTYTYTIEHSTAPSEVGGPVATSSTVECVAGATAPTTLPVVKDVCGNVLEAPSPVEGGTYTDCDGTKTYTYTYKDCANKEFVWTYTYTIEHSTAPSEFGKPVATSSTVECLAAATAPAILPVVKDVCGNELTVPTPEVADSPENLTCAGTRTYTYTYKDCANKTFVWTYTYTIDKKAPVIASEGYVTSKNISSMSEDVEPTTDMIPTATNSCGGSVTPTMNRTTDWTDGKENCSGKIIYTYTYTDCGKISEWSYTYNLNDDIKPVITTAAPLDIEYSDSEFDSKVETWLASFSATRVVAVRLQ